MKKDRGRDLEGQVAVVTGAGRGVGRAIAGRLAKDGAAVCLIARSADDVERAADAIESGGGSALALALDVTDRVAVERAFAAIEHDLGPVSILINNAGTLDAIGPLWDVDPDVWWRDMQVHVRGAVLCSHAALSGMVPRGSGRLVNVVGMLGQEGDPYATAYACAKAALFRLTDCLSNELQHHGIGVFCISPGPVRTEMTRRLVESDIGRRWLPVFGDLPDDDWIPADVGADLVVRIARGDADGFSGRFIHVSQDLDELIAQGDEIRSTDRLMMRLIR